jgi:predicted glycoside hydrolase/deacetylase ChbG (UPF0249 family)
MKRLIVHADDLGLTNGVSAGIAEAISCGIVTGAAAMVCVDGAKDCIRRWIPVIKGSIGLHLQITDGKPCLEPELVPSLVNEDGRFPRSWRDLGKINKNELHSEWMAQIECFRGLGFMPNYIDTHHHVHRMVNVFSVYWKIAQTLRVPARTVNDRATQFLRTKEIPCADHCDFGIASGEVTETRVLDILKRVLSRYDTVELVCHPGFPDEELTLKSTYVKERQQELEALTSPDLAGQITKLGVELCDVSVLK